MTLLAFETTAEDIENVLRAYALRVHNADGQSFSTMAVELVCEIDHARIEKAALASGCDLATQARGAFDEIKQNLVELGVLDF